MATQHIGLIVGRGSSVHVVQSSGEAFNIIVVHLDLALWSVATRQFLHWLRARVDEWNGPHWQWQSDRTQELASAIEDSAPNPAGLLYARWAAAPPAAHELLDAVAQRMQEGCDLPAEMSRSVTLTMPKARERDSRGSAARLCRGAPERGLHFGV